MSRRDTILAGLNLDGLGLEIGPSHNPVAAGAPGLRVRTLDMLDQAALVAKFAAIGQDTARIQPVDYVWSGQPYRELVGETRFDWIVASHVIEHVPDIVGFIGDCAEILTPGGVLSLAVPDKRGTFDFYRPPAGLAPVVDAHLERRGKASPGAAAEFELNVSDYDAHPSAPPLLHAPERVRGVMDAVVAGQMVDVHAWTFTPSSFRLLIADLDSLGLIPLREARFGESVGYEFYMQLSREAAGCGLTRETLGRRALEDLGSAEGEGRLESARARMAAVAADNAALKAELEAVRRTLSWRVTAPLRALRRLRS